MATNTATVKMIRNIIDGTTPIQSRALLNSVFPVGTIIYRTDAMSPASIYGGSWERIVDKFLYSVGGGALIRRRGRRSRTYDHARRNAATYAPFKSEQKSERRCDGK